MSAVNRNIRAERPTRRALVLGGTEEGLRVAEALAERSGWSVTYSLAGRTSAPRLPKTSNVRVGGFGGVAGLTAWLGEQKCNLLIDATHPYADLIAINSTASAKRARVFRLRIEREGWEAGQGDRWARASNIDQALIIADLLTNRAMAAIGAGEIDRLMLIPRVEFWARTVEPPLMLSGNVKWLQGKGPFEVEGELRLMERHRIGALVCRNSGGKGGYAKIEAARLLGLPVVMIDRPKAGRETPGSAIVDNLDNSVVFSVAEALAVIDQRFA